MNFFLQEFFGVTVTHHLRLIELLVPRTFCFLAWNPRPSAVTCSGLDDVSADLVAPRLSLSRRLVGWIDFNPSSLHSSATVPRGSAHLGVYREAPERVGGPSGDAPRRTHTARTGRRRLGSPACGAPPLPRPARWRRRAAHVTGALVPPPGGRSEFRPRRAGGSLGLWARRARGTRVKSLAGGVLWGWQKEIRVAAFYCTGSDLLDTYM